MNWYRKAQSEEKILYLTRGIQGSGKSFKAKSLAPSDQIFSADDFFMVDGKYQFDPNYLSDAHFWNNTRIQEAISKGITPIVVDNTHVEAWSMKVPVQMAIKAGYKIKIIEPDTPWAFNAEELAKRNQHGVPLDVIQQKLQEWEPDITVDDILKSQKPESS